jgi:hypothetical protein
MLSRREFITTASGALIVGFASTSKLLARADTTGKPIYAGWVPNKRSTINFKAQQKMPMFADAARELAGSGSKKKALLWKFFEKASGDKLIPHDQTIGDCVAHGWGLGVDILDAVQITHGRGGWVAKSATEVIYTGGRVEIGKGKIAGDGMHGSWAGQWCRDGGVLLRQPYLDGKYDFTRYSGSKSRKWAHICRRCTTWGGGVPDELEPLAKKHPVKTITLVTSWEEARDAVYNGYPVVVCSNYGFSTERDRDGFASRKGFWFHCLLLAGIDDTGNRPGGLFLNSWGPNWINGPTRFEQPLGSFWADASDIDGMLSQEDSFAMSNYIGYPRQNLDYKLY